MQHQVNFPVLDSKQAFPSSCVHYGFSQFAGDTENLFFVTSQPRTVNLVFGKGALTVD